MIWYDFIKVVQHRSPKAELRKYKNTRIWNNKQITKQGNKQINVILNDIEIEIEARTNNLIWIRHQSF